MKNARSSSCAVVFTIEGMHRFLDISLFPTGPLQASCIEIDQIVRLSTALHYVLRGPSCRDEVTGNTIRFSNHLGFFLVWGVTIVAAVFFAIG